MKILKTIINAIKSGLGIGIKNFGIPTVDLLIAQNPEWFPSWLLIKGYFGVLFDLKQEKINELVIFIKNNPNKFTKEIVDTREFQDAFIITFENYLRQRNEKKRIIIQRILLGFIASKDKDSFELEKMYNILNNISLEGIKVLKIAQERVLFDKKHKKIDFDYFDEIKYLEYLGLLTRYTDDISICGEEINGNPILSFDDKVEQNYFILSYFGREFVEFVEINK